MIAGIDTYPLKVTKTMSQKKIKKRSRVKPFIKAVNFNHIMPTRYNVDIDVKSVVNPSNLKKEDARIEARKEVKKLFENRCASWPAAGRRWLARHVVLAFGTRV